ncbi:MAG: Unknown protein [uncultured Aureispira sp.]|uniref:Uncharacterized protein n=1 Tax=uncultured Aureispira sp. TaxID=1331704 RepID=A0A6S6UHH3_9BACT|nr:MAG: Unknown protein [uncultured Aureispira sp.]
MGKLIRAYENYILYRNFIPIDWTNLRELKTLYQFDKAFYFVRQGICNNNLLIQGNKCVFFFMNQCACEFTCELIGRKIDVLWEYEIDYLARNDLDLIVRLFFLSRS